MAKMTVIQAITNAIAVEMARDPTVVVLGEDVGINGGVFRATDGLLAKYGEKRVMDTPLAESGIAGLSVGLAAGGLKPILETQFDGFAYMMFHQFKYHASELHWRSRGKFNMQMVLRCPYGGGIRALEHHSEGIESFFVHMPGCKVVCPSNPYDAKGLLIASIRDPNAVVFLEPKKIYRAIKGEVPEEEAYTVPLGKAAITREGKDVSIITWGAQVHQALEAAEALKGKYDVEVVDLRTLSPLDEETLLNSVKKTGRAIVVHEAPRTGGFGAEIAALIQEKALLSMQSPVLRLTGFDTPVPLARMEDYNLPNAKRIAKYVEKAMSF